MNKKKIGLTAGALITGSFNSKTRELTLISKIGIDRNNVIGDKGIFKLVLSDDGKILNGVGNDSDNSKQGVFYAEKQERKKTSILYTDIDEQVKIDQKGNPEVTAIKNIKLNLNALKNNTLSLRIPLFNDEFIDIEKMNTDKSERIGTNYKIGKDPNGRVIVSEVKGKYAIDIILSKGKIYQIRYVKEGIYQIKKIDQSKYPPEGSTPVQSNSSGDPLPCANTDPPDQIDVMVLYTDDVMTVVGDRDAIEAEIYLALYETNFSYLNSNINQRLEIVHIAEVDYAQSDSIQEDLDRLRNASDGFMDNIHTLRDAYAADLVCLIKENDTRYCGWAYTMTSVSDAFEDRAFSVVSRWCITNGNYSFAHELGHNMGAQHDCDGDPVNLPFDYAHGHVKPSTATGSCRRTIMGSDPSCVRVLNWSHPGINYPSSSVPTGTSTGTCRADNHLTLNNTASVVANFRCRSRGPDNVWMRDTWSDTGLEPDPATSEESMYRSPYIWIRNSQDVNLNSQYQHQNPQGGSTNYVYVKLLNGGASMSGNLELFYANASTSLSWPSNWTLIESKPVTMAASTSDIIEFNWSSLPGEGHYCLVAKWVSASDPMAVAEGPNIAENARNNNNIVWRNVNIAPMSSGDSYASELDFEGRSSIIRLSFNNDKYTQYINQQFIKDAGNIQLQFDEHTNFLIKKGRIKLKGLKETKNGYKVISSNECYLKINEIDQPYKGKMKLNFSSNIKSPKRKYDLNVNQQIEGKKGNGGVFYEINLEAIK